MCSGKVSSCRRLKNGGLESWNVPDGFCLIILYTSLGESRGLYFQGRESSECVLLFPLNEEKGLSFRTAGIP